MIWELTQFLHALALGETEAAHKYQRNNFHGVTDNIEGSYINYQKERQRYQRGLKPEVC